MALWEPALRSDVIGEHGAPVRRSAGAEAARVMADLIVEGAQTLTFVRSRRAAELTALGARARLVDIAPELSDTVASYRAGYLAEDRSALHQALAEGQLRGLATTNALELGVDIAGLDAVVLAGFPGTVASFWQQAGRSGRRGQGALVVLIARDDPLDTYLVHHPAALLDKPVERVVIDPVNPHLLGPQLLCAATELPLDDAEVRSWGAVEVAESLVDDGLLRRRNGRYFPAPGVKPHAAVDVRGLSVARSSSWRPEPGGSWAAWASVRPRPQRTQARCTCTRARPTSLTRWISRTESPSCTPRIPAMPRSRERSPTSRSPAPASGWSSGPLLWVWCR